MSKLIQNINYNNLCASIKNPRSMHEAANLACIIHRRLYTAM